MFWPVKTMTYRKSSMSSLQQMRLLGMAWTARVASSRWSRGTVTMRDNHTATSKSPAHPDAPALAWPPPIKRRRSDRLTWASIKKIYARWRAKATIFVTVEIATHPQPPSSTRPEMAPRSENHNTEAPHMTTLITKTTPAIRSNLRSSSEVKSDVKSEVKLNLKSIQLAIYYLRVYKESCITIWSWISIHWYLLFLLTEIIKVDRWEEAVAFFESDKIDCLK